jgi:hypothetical protein
MTTTNTSLAPWACRSWGLVAAAIGLGASAVGAWFFILGLQQTEPDAAARNVLVWAGGLMACGQLAAFAVAAWLPRTALRALRWVLLALGVLLFASEVATMTVTQLALAAGADATAAAQASRAAEVRSAIDSRRATAAGLRDNAAVQSRSVLAPSRAAGAEALQQALAIEAEISPLAAELARLEASRRPTVASLLGSDHLVWFAGARAALIALVGMVMMSAAGALFRLARSQRPALPFEPMAVPVERPVVAPPAPVRLASGPHPVQGRFSAAAAAFPMAVVTAAVPGLAPAVPLAPAPARQVEQRAPEQAPAPVPAQPVPEQAAAPAPAPVPAPAAVPEPAPEPAPQLVCLQAPNTEGCGLNGGEEQPAQAGLEEQLRANYMQVLQGVRNGAIKPSVREVRAAVGGATATVQKYLRQMEQDGVIGPRDKGRGYMLLKGVR